MYDAKVVATFECVELELQAAISRINNITVGSFTRDEKAIKRIIGDMAHTYFATFLNVGVPGDIETLENVVSELSEKFPDVHFQVTTSKSNLGEIQGAYIRVGATPPTDKPLAAEAIDKILGEDTDEPQTETEAEAECQQ